MQDKLITQLEEIASAERFVIIDTSSLVYRNEKKQDIFYYLANKQKIAQLPKEVLEDTVAVYRILHNILCRESTAMTKETIMEFNRGIEMMIEKINEFKQRNPANKFRTQEDFERAYKTVQAEKLVECAGRIKQAAETRRISFADTQIYHELFEFFRQIAPIVNFEKMRKTEKKYLFGDESISAAVLYFTITGEKNCQTTIVTQDHDIRQQIRMAYHLFSRIDKGFQERVEKTPFKLYMPKPNMQGEQAEYIPLLNSNDKRTISILERAPQTVEQINALLEIANNTIHKIKQTD